MMSAVNSGDESTDTNGRSILIEESTQSPITTLKEEEEKESPLLLRPAPKPSNVDAATAASSCTNCGYHNHHTAPESAGESTLQIAPPSSYHHPPSYHPYHAPPTAVGGPPTPHHTVYHPSSSYRYPEQLQPLLPPPPLPPYRLQQQQPQHGISHQYSTGETATAPANESLTTRTTSSLSTGAPLLVSAVAFGSLLGITAAAAVRWLNGDDFVLFPHSTTDAATTSTTTIPSTDVEDNVEATTVGNTTNDDSLQQQPHEQTAVLREIVRTRSDKQSALLQRLEELVSKQQQMEEYIEVTNQSIDDLRQQQQINSKASGKQVADTSGDVSTWLHSIQHELSLIRESLTPIDRDRMSSKVDDPMVLHSRLLAVLSKIDATLDGAVACEMEERNGELRSSHSEMVPPTASSTDDTPESKATPFETIDLTLTQQPVHGNSLLKAFSKTMPLNGGGRTVSSATSSTSLGCSSALRDAICELVMSNTKEKLVSGAQLLYLYVVNVASHPRVPRYRKIFCNNESYQQNVATLQGARDLLMAVGFVEKEPIRPSPQRAYATSSLSANSIKQASHWEWLPSPESPPDDALATTDPISPSCTAQKPWFDDAEAALVERLKEATAALAVLKITTVSDKDDLIYAALSSAGLLVEDRKAPFIDQTGPAVTVISQKPVDAIKSSDQIDLDSTQALDETGTPQRKNGEEFTYKATLQDSSNILRPMMACNDATTPDRTIGCNGSATSYGSSPSIVSINSSLLETPPFSGSIVSPPATKSVMTLNKDFTLQPMSPTESKAELEPAPAQLLQFATTELHEEMDHGESGASGLSDEAEAAMWK